ncbi:hypothetical protein ACE1TI_17935 [Alteribacillus sp. JSM 102045]|uniref:hypothetical protein n=1 Tax=Alteribacillus sp. JSM 102045 TaxID=1562101 RepID=UPI0035C066CF
MLAYRNLYKDQLSEIPRTKVEKEHTGYDSHRGWVFMCNSFQEKSVAVRTYQSLLSLNHQYTYFTPNNQKRTGRSIKGERSLFIYGDHFFKLAYKK